jgi:nucleotide-binding universal stress UspA family protein
MALCQFTKILSPVDFSDASIHAFDHAVAIAGWYGAELTILNVRPPTVAQVPDLPVSQGAGPAPDLERAQEQISDCVRVARGAGIPTNVLIDVGQPAADIVGRAASIPADLIVMGTHGVGGFDHLVLGSVTEGVVQRAPCPVLTVPPRARTTSKLPFRHVVCAIDFSEWSLEAMRFAFSLAQEAGSTVTLAHVLEWPWEEPPAPEFGELPAAQATALHEYRRYMEQGAMVRLGTLRPDPAQDRVVVTRKVLHGKAHEVVLRLAAEDRADLIVLGVHGRPMAEVRILGSTTNQVVRRATCPVLTLRR